MFQTHSGGLSPPVEKQQTFSHQVFLREKVASILNLLFANIGCLKVGLEIFLLKGPANLEEEINMMEPIPEIHYANNETPDLHSPGDLMSNSTSSTRSSYHDRLSKTRAVMKDQESDETASFSGGSDSFYSELQVRPGDEITRALSSETLSSSELDFNANAGTIIFQALLDFPYIYKFLR